MTREEAIKFSESQWWKGLSAQDIAAFQLFEDKLCMPFGEFHEAVEEALGRPVWTHEFAFLEHLRQEFIGQAEPLTLQQILELIPEEKRVLVVVD